MHRRILSTPLFEALKETADKLFRCYQGYRLSLTSLNTSRDDAAKLKLIEGQRLAYRSELVKLAGSEAIDRLDEQLGVSMAGHR